MTEPDLPDNPDIVFLEIADRDNLGLYDMLRAVEMFRDARQVYPQKPILIAVGGYDEDPRELWDIPEVCRFIQQWARGTNFTDPEEAGLSAIPVTAREVTDRKWAASMLQHRIEFVGLLGACGCWNNLLTVPAIIGKKR